MKTTDSGAAGDVPASGDREVVVTRVFDAPRELVWRVWTDPAQVSAWWGPRGFTTTTHAMDFREGGTWRSRMHGPDGVDYPNRVVYDEIVPPSRRTYHHAGEEGTADIRFHVTVTLVDRDGRTELTLRSVFPTPEERAFVVEKHGAIQGAEQTLERLAQLLAPGT